MKTPKPLRRLHYSQWVRRPIEEVFRFFADEANLEALTPPWLHFHVVGKSTAQLENGTLIDYRLRIRGVPTKWRSRIEQWKPNQSFIDTQVVGPYRYWHHTHRFTPERGGTLVEDQVLYRLPLGKLGDTLLGWWVERDLERVFEFRIRKITEILGS